METCDDDFAAAAKDFIGRQAKADKPFKNFPPIQRPNSFTIDDAVKMMSESAGAHR
jgi:hypothetical protein